MVKMVKNCDSFFNLWTKSMKTCFLDTVSQDYRFVPTQTQVSLHLKRKQIFCRLLNKNLSKVCTVVYQKYIVGFGFFKHSEKQTESRSHFPPNVDIFCKISEPKIFLVGISCSLVHLRMVNISLSSPNFVYDPMLPLFSQGHQGGTWHLDLS